MERGGLDRPLRLHCVIYWVRGFISFLVDQVHREYTSGVLLIYYVCGESISSIYIEVHLGKYTII
jgi:hypothetical protein